MGLTFLNVKNWQRDESGTVAVIFAVSIAVIITIMAMALEWSRMTQSHTRLLDITDGAALAAATAAMQDEGDRKKIAKAYISDNGGAALDAIMTGDPKIVFDDDNLLVRVEVNARVPSIFSAFVGREKFDIQAESIASFGDVDVAPVSMAFALDVSGSMGWDTSDGEEKIEVLKDSTKILFKALEDGTPDKKQFVKKLRTGMSAYNTELVDEYPMSEGWNNLFKSVKKLVADGGTNSTPALQNSYDQLQADRSFRVAQGDNIDDLVEIVIFMTDGDNNQADWDQESVELCYTMREENIQIYSIAFEAPTKGEIVLLDCASFNDQEKGLPDDIADNPGKNKNGHDPSKCENNGSKGKGKARGHCKTGPVQPSEWDEMRVEKSRYYFDTENAAAFQEAFEQIGLDIAETYIRLTQ